MRQLSLLIQQLRTQLKSEDQTNTANYRELAEEYASYCEMFKQANQKCQEFLDRGMIAECASYAETLNPSLHDLSTMLNFPELQEFRELCKMYDWQEPGILNDNTLKNLMKKLQKTQNMEPLVAEFRKIARTDNLVAKYVLLRQITQQAPKSRDWISMRRGIEKELFAKYAKEAKEAIINSDFTNLENLKERITSTEWIVETNPAVLNKINAVLEEQHRKMVEEDAKAILEKINIAYGAFDYSALKTNLSQWEELIEKENYVPTEEMNSQVSEAHAYFLREEENRKNEKEIKKITESLRIGLEREYPLENLEKIVHMLQLRNAEIPEQLQRRFMAYKEDTERIRKRKTVLIYSLSAAAAIVVIVIIVLAINHYREGIIETRWATTISKKINTLELEDAEKILKKLEKNMPKLRKRKKIAELAEGLNQKKQERNAERKEFAKIADRIRENLKTFATSTRSQVEKDLALLEKYKIDRALLPVIEDLQKQIEKKRLESQFDEENKFREISKNIREVEKQFNTSLENNDFNQAKKLLSECERYLEETRHFDLVSEQIRNTEHPHVIVGRMRDDLEKKRRTYDEFNAKLYSVNEATSIDELIRGIKEVAPYLTKTDFPKTLLDQADQCNRFLNQYRGKKFSNDFSILQKTADDLASLQKREEEFYSELIKFIDKTFGRWYNEDPMKTVKSVIFKTQDEKRFEFFYKNQYGKIEIDGQKFYQFALAGSSKTVQMAVEFPHVIFLDWDGKKTNGYLCFPSLDILWDQNKSNSNKPGHIQELEKLKEEIETNKADKNKICEIVIKFVENLLHDEAFTIRLHPVYRRNYANTMTTLLCKLDPLSTEFISMKNALKTLTPLNKKYLLNASYFDKDFIKETERLDQELSKIKINMHSGIGLRKKILTTALSRTLLPCGYFWKGKPNALGTVFWKLKDPNIPDDCELWIIGDKGIPEIIGFMKKGHPDISSAYKNKIADGTIVLCTTDDISSSENLWNDFRKQAADLGIKKLEKPVLWPAQK